MTESDRQPPSFDDILSERIWLDVEPAPRDKSEVLRMLSVALEPATGVSAATLETMFVERESLQSTGVGAGVAVPHIKVEGLEQHRAALLVFRKGVAFDAIDGEPVQIVFGIAGPSSAALHLRVLARVSRLLRSAANRRKLIESNRVDDILGILTEPPKQR